MVARSQKAARTTQTPVNLLARTAVEGILDKKGFDITVMDMRRVSGVADVFVLCTGEADLQIKAIVDEVEARIKETHGERPWHREGYEFRQWVVLDYVDLVVHVFNPERREFYGIERLWGDAPRETIGADGSSDDLDLLKDDGGTSS